MKKTAKNTLISVLGASFIAMSLPAGLSAGGADTAEFKVRIEGINECLYYGTVSVPCDDGGLTFADVLRFVDESEDGIELTWTTSYYGDYISGVNGEMEASFDAYDGWTGQINGVSLVASVGESAVNDGDSLLFSYTYYSLDGSVSTQYPEMSYDNQKGILSFTSDDTVYDENWNASIVTNPVAGVTVTWSRDGNSEELVSDENGNIVIPKKLLSPGVYSVQYEKKGSSGEPLVLRSEPGLTVTVDYLKGDINGDRSITAVDAANILNAYAINQTTGETVLSDEQKAAADVSGDGKITAVDAAKTLAYYAYVQVGGTGSLDDYLNSNLGE